MGVMKDITDITKFLTKIKTAIVLLLLIAILSIAGTIIPQHQNAQFYHKAYGEIFGNIIVFSSFNDVYHSWWFTSLLLLLTVSIVLCSYKRVINNVKGVFSPNLDLEISSYDENIKVENSLENTFSQMLGLFKKKHYKINNNKTSNKAVFQLQKNILNVFGSSITHFSIILILLGAVIGSIFGYTYYLNILEGTTVDVPKTDIKFRLDDFTLEYYFKTTTPKLYRSDISIIDKNNKIVKKIVEVNKPLQIKGIQFSQNSYGQHGFKGVFIHITDNKKKKGVGTFKVKVGQIVDLPDGYKLKVDDYLPDFRINEKKEIFSASKDPNNPAIKLTVYHKSKGSSESFWSFIRFPAMSSHKQSARYSVKFQHIVPYYYSVLQAVRDPGLGIVLLGFCLLTLGVFVIYIVMYYKYIVVLEKSNSSQTMIRIKGFSRRPEFLKEKTDKLVQSIKEITGGI